MVDFIEIPHLPEGRVKHIILGEKYRNILEIPLFEHGLCPVWLPDDPYCDERLAGHADISAVHLGGNKLAVAEYIDCDFFNGDVPNNPEIIKLNNITAGRYPQDAAYNICIIGKYVLANEKTADKQLMDILRSKKHISCRQGYTKCAVSVVDERSVITADKGIADALTETDIDVLYIDDLDVELSGYDKGFIGGAAFKIANDELAFTGAIENAVHKAIIEQFLNERGIRAVYLTDRKVFDIGSAIPLTEIKP